MELTSLNNKKGKRSISHDLIYGKVPPHATDLEEWVLGACMMQGDAIDLVMEILKPQCFYREVHQVIFSAMLKLQSKGIKVDILSVVHELKRLEQLEQVGGPTYITRLTNTVVSTANLENHARIILQKFIQRELIRISGEIIGKAYEDSTDTFDLLDEAETSIFSIVNHYLRKDFTTAQAEITKMVVRIDKQRVSNEELSGVPSGFTTLDRITYGWQQTDLIILAARPAVGKTAFALNLARNAALHPTKPTPVAFFSLEMSAAQLISRLTASESNIELNKINRGKLSDYEYNTMFGGIKRLEEIPLYIDDTAALNIFEFRAKARRLVNKHQVGLIIIDYLQLMNGTGEKGQNREQQISTISRNMKSLAKELNVPIIALSQLSRAVETRKESKMPQLSDLRESGAIEQDADMVMFIYRPEYYEISSNEQGESTHGETHVRIAKHRNGSLETIKLRAKLEIQKFEEWDDNGSGVSGSNWKPLSSIRDFTQSNKSFDDGFNDDPF